MRVCRSLLKLADTLISPGPEKYIQNIDRLIYAIHKSNTTLQGILQLKTLQNNVTVDEVQTAFKETIPGCCRSPDDATKLSLLEP